MHCPSCGTQVEDDARFCITCGTSLEKFKNNTKRSTQSQRSGSDTFARNHYARSSRSRYNQRDVNPFLYVCSFCVPIVGIVLTFVYWNDNRDAALGMLFAAFVGLIFALMINAGR